MPRCWRSRPWPSVREGRTKFVPQSYENTYFAWLENIKPWCISRQLWWGHQIPAWYGPRISSDPDFGNSAAGPKVFVAGTEAEALKQAQAYYGTRAGTPHLRPCLRILPEGIAATSKLRSATA